MPERYNALRQIFKAAVENANVLSHRSFWLNTRGKTVGPCGFITNDIEGQMLILWAMRLYLSCADKPNPTSGFLLFYARKDVRVLDMSIEEGARLVISAGMTNTIEEGEA